MLAHVYEHTEPTAGLRKLLIKWLGWKKPLEWFGSPENLLRLSETGEMATDLAVCWNRRLASPAADPFNLPPNDGSIRTMNAVANAYFARLLNKI